MVGRVQPEKILTPRERVDAHQRAAAGVREFVLALGYRGEVIKEYFLNFYAVNSDLTIDLRSGRQTIYDGVRPDWRVHLVHTGHATQTGGRVRRLEQRHEIRAGDFRDLGR